MSQRFCTQCGEKLPQDGNFCPNCGAPVDGEDGEISAPPAPETPADPVAQLDAELIAQNAVAEQPSGSSRTLLYGLGAAALVVVLLVAGYFAFVRPDQEELAASGGLDTGRAEAVSDAPQNDADIPYPEIPRISADDAHIRLASDSAIFVDVRDRDSYAELHIPGALWIPLDEVEARQGELPKDAEIILYCT